MDRARRNPTARKAKRRTKRTVKRARRAAHTATSAASGASTDTTPYEQRTADELYQLASDREIEGRSSMTKEELIAALRVER